MTPPPLTRATAGRATFLVAFGACSFGAISILVEIATRAGAPLLGVLTWRYVLAAGVLLLVLLRSGRRPDARGFRVMMTAGLMQALIAVLSLSALRYISAATLAFLFYTYPGMVAVLARLRHSEPLTAKRLVALALALSGIFIMVGAPGSLHPIGIALALISALLYALYIPMIEKMQRELSPVATAMYMATGAALFLGVGGFYEGELALRSMTVWSSVVVLAVVCTATAFMAFLSGLDVLGPLRTAIVSTVEPFFTALLGAWFLSQPMTSTVVAGGALIAAAVILLQWKPANNGRAPAT